MSMKWVICLVLVLVLCPVSSHATNYFISPSGSDSNNGLSTSAPFKTFAFALNSARAWCGHTLILMNGTYSNAAGTGQINHTIVCTAGNELTIKALNQRQAQLFDNGCADAVQFTNSAYITLDGLYVRSQDNASCTASGAGQLITLIQGNHMTIRNVLGVNPNRYANSNAIIPGHTDVLVEDTEIYTFHRHCTSAAGGLRITIRRVYCQPGTGKIPGGFGLDQGPLGTGASLFSMYPCTDCIIENSIADSTVGGMFLNEQNAKVVNGVANYRNKVLGSIVYNSDYGAGVNPNPRGSGLNYAPHDGVYKDLAFINHRSASPAVNCQDCANFTVDHISAFGDTLANPNFDSNGVNIDLPAFRARDMTGTFPGVDVSLLNVDFKNSFATGFKKAGFSVEYTGTWSGDKLYSTGNGSTFSPSLPSHWTNTSTAALGMGTCKLWVPDSSPLKGAASDGGDIGATILYRYQDGVLTTEPLWDPVTGEFPHGATVTGVNDIAGQSLFDFHKRVNVNTNGCLFPAGYGGSTPQNPTGVVKSTDVSGAHVQAIPANMDSLTVAVAVRHDGLNVSDATGLVSSCGNQTIPVLLSAYRTPANDRSQTLFGVINPNAGTCTLTPTFGGANISGWTMVSVQKDNVASYGIPVGGSFQTANPSISIPSNPDQTLLDFLATSKAVTDSLCANQIQNGPAISHPSVSLQADTSEKSAANGSQMCRSLGGSVGWILQGVAFVPPGGGGPSGSTFRVSKYRIDGLLGVSGSPEVTLGALGSQDQAAQVSTTGAFRIRAEVIVETAASAQVDISLYCRKNGGTYNRVDNSFGSGVVRSYGAGSDPKIPAHGTPTTQRFSGTFAAGKTIRDGASSVVLNSMATNTRTELDFQLVLGNGAAAGDVIECEVRRGDGSTLGTHTVLPTITAVGPSASMGF